MSKTAGERYLLDEFFRKCCWLPQRRIYKREPPAPDFIIRDMGLQKRIGLEVTRYFANRQVNQGSYSKRLEVAWEKIKKGINDKIQHVTCIISLKQPNLPNNKNNQKEFARELLSCISPYSCDKESNLEYHILNFNNFPMLKDFVTKIVFYFHKKVDINMWDVIPITCGGVGISEDELKQIIDCKKSKIGFYRKIHIDELILLIIATGETLSQVASPLVDLLIDKAERIQDFLKSSGFDKIFFFERSIGDISLICPITENQDFRKQYLIKEQKITYDDLNDKEKKIVDEVRKRCANKIKNRTIFRI